MIAVIGIDRYRHWPSLSNAVTDARGAAALFEQLGFQQVIEPLIDDAATAAAIRSLVTDDLASLDPDDSLVLFYAGHGGTRSRDVGDRVIKTGYLIPVDAYDKVATWVDLEGWLRDVALLPPRHILVLLDACHSGIALAPILKWRDGASWRNAPLDSLRARRSRRIITSALEGQIALDSGPIDGHSLFTGCMIEALTYGVRPGTTQITCSELGVHLQQRVDAFPEAKQTPDFGTFAFDDRGEMVIPLLVGRRSQPPTPVIELSLPAQEPPAMVPLYPVPSHRTSAPAVDPDRRGRPRGLIIGGALLGTLVVLVLALTLARQQGSAQNDDELAKPAHSEEKIAARAPDRRELQLAGESATQADTRTEPPRPAQTDDELAKLADAEPKSRAPGRREALPTRKPALSPDMRVERQKPALTNDALAKPHKRAAKSGVPGQPESPPAPKGASQGDTRAEPLGPGLTDDELAKLAEAEAKSSAPDRPKPQVASEAAPPADTRAELLRLSVTDDELAKLAKLAEQCDAKNVDNLVRQAGDQAGAGHWNAALQQISKALECKQDDRWYRMAAIYACGAHQAVVAKRYYARVSLQVQREIAQRCLQQGIAVP